MPNDFEIWKHDGFTGKRWNNGLWQLNLYKGNSDQALGLFYNVLNETSFRWLVIGYQAGQNHGFLDGKRSKAESIKQMIDNL